MLNSEISLRMMDALRERAIDVRSVVVSPHNKGHRMAVAIEDPRMTLRFEVNADRVDALFTEGADYVVKQVEAAKAKFARPAANEGNANESAPS